MSGDKPRILITSAIPYINGIKHLGNLVGSQLPADLYARYMRGRGHEVLFLCATDEHGTPAELAAAKAGKPVFSQTPNAFSQAFSSKVRPVSSISNPSGT